MLNRFARSGAGTRRNKSKQLYCLVAAYAAHALMYAFMIQHILKGISAPTADCRPPALRMIGSVKTLGDLTHPAVSGFYIASYGKAVNILKGLYALFSV